MSFLRAAAAFVIWAGAAAPAVAGSVGAQDSATLRVHVHAPATATVSVSVRKEDAGPPATQTRTSPAAQGGRVTSFTGLEAGTYLVTAGMLDGGTTTLSVRVQSREIVTLRALLGSGGATPSSLEFLDRLRVGEGPVFDERWLNDLPATDVWALAETAVPFVIADRMDNGGLGTGRSALLGSRGASWTTATVAFGDIEVLAPNVFGLVPFAIDLGAVSEVSVTSGLAPIEVDAPGVRLALSPKRPGPTRYASLQSAFTEPGMVDVNELPDAPSISRLATWREFSAQLSGPLRSGSGLLLSGRFARAQHHERDRQGLWTSDATSIFGHFVTNRTDLGQVRLVGTLQRVNAPYDGRRQFRDVNVSEQGTFWQSSAAWDRVGARGARIGATLAFQRGAFTPLIDNPKGGTVDRVTDGIVPAPAADVASTQWEAASRFSAPLLTWGRTAHELRAGVTVRRAAASAELLALPAVAELVGGLAARVWLPNQPAGISRRSLVHTVAYVADRLTIGSSLTVNAGLRFDTSSGSSAGAVTGIDWRTLSPRVSAQWGRGPVALFGGIGRYTDPLMLSLLGYGDRGEAVSDVHRWHDLNGNQEFDTGELGVLVSRMGRGSAVASIAAGLRAPGTTERTVGIELRHGQVMTFRASAAWRKQSSLVGSINTGVPLSSYRVIQIPDAYEDWDGAADDQPLVVYDRLPESFGQDAFLLTNPDEGTTSHDGLEATWELNTRRLLVLFGATAYRTRSRGGHLGFGPLENDQGVIGAVFEQPNARPVVQGSYFFDRSYVGKWSTSYRAPGDVHIGFSARYQDGQPFTRFVIAEDLAGGPEMVHAYRIGRTRFTYTLTLDIRIEKGFSLGAGRAAVRLDVFNATRHRNEVEEDARTTPDFRRSTAVQPPLTVRFGFQFVF